MMTRTAIRPAGVRLPTSFTRLIAVVLAISLVGPIQPWVVLAQTALDCGVNGFCLSGSINTLLGLPNGTLKIVGYQPWDLVVKGEASVAWAPLEAEARATLAALHGVPNDDRLPYA